MKDLSIFVAVSNDCNICTKFIFLILVLIKIYINNNDEDEGTAKWSLKKAISILVISTVLIAIESEFLVNGIEAYN